MSRSDESRLSELETKVAFLERDLDTIKEATQSIHNYSQELDRKIDQVKRMVEKPEVEQEE